VPSDELPRYYSAADLFVHAAEVELEGMSVLEAMACGAPRLIARAPKSAASQFAPDPRYLFESGPPQRSGWSATTGPSDCWHGWSKSMLGCRHGSLTDPQRGGQQGVMVGHRGVRPTKRMLGRRRSNRGKSAS
jgi:hypothetical protein